VLVSLQQAIDTLDCGHSRRVTAIAEELARWLEWDDLRLQRLRIGSRLHDVGKLMLSTELLRKPGPLDEIELAEMRTHPLAGASLVQGISHGRLALTCILYHHERWDGHGYPSGLAAEEIPAEARLLAVCDAFDAMTRPRSYRETRSLGEALEELERCGGGQFDPDLADAFLAAWAEISLRLEPLLAIPATDAGASVL
jgi:HD-GYP domain-containing protein (c-di-GMP phosphodiesterase class II)